MEFTPLLSFEFIARSYKLTEAHLRYFEISLSLSVQSLKTSAIPLGVNSCLDPFQLVAYYLVIGNPAHVRRLLWYKLGAERSKQALKAIINSNQASLLCIQ